MSKSATLEEILASRPDSERKAIKVHTAKLTALRTRVRKGLDDIAAGRVNDFNVERIVIDPARIGLNIAQRCEANPVACCLLPVACCRSAPGRDVAPHRALGRSYA